MAGRKGEDGEEGKERTDRGKEGGANARRSGDILMIFRGGEEHEWKVKQSANSIPSAHQTHATRQRRTAS